MDNDGKETPLDKSLKALLDRRRTQSTLRNLTLSAAQQVDFSSNDFLSLSTSPILKSAFIKELQASDLPIGSGGSRLLDGNSSYAEDLERMIAEFHGAKSGLLFNSGFDANVGFFACVPQPGDIIIYDSLIHASVHDGMRLSRASSCLPFAHNSVSSLRSVLQSCLSGSQTFRAGKSHIFIAVEAIYSMDGDLCPLQSVISTVETVLGTGRGYVVVDEAHSTGVLGSNGRGLVSSLDLGDKVFARLHTFGKALACNGAIVLGSQILRQYLINYARPLIYTTFMSYPSLAAIKASYGLLISGQTVQLAEDLRNLISTLFSLLNAANSSFRDMLRVPETCPGSPIFSVQTQEPKLLAKFLQERGMMVRAVVPPTVPEGTERVRVCLHAGNTVDEIRTLVGALEFWAMSRRQDLEGKFGKDVAEKKANDSLVVGARL